MPDAEHVLADLSANYVEKQALLCGFSAERVRLDYGIDLMVQTFNRRGEVENGWLPFQLKATDRLKVVTGSRAVSCRIDRADLRHWLNESLPVILALYDARADRAYWLFVRRHFAALPGFELHRAGERVSVSIPRSNVLDRSAMRYLAREKNDLLEEAGEGGFPCHPVTYRSPRCVSCFSTSGSWRRSCQALRSSSGMRRPTPFSCFALTGRRTR